MSSIVIQGDTSGSITVEAPSVAGTHTLTLPKATGTIATNATVGLGTKNLIINGDMQIAQRGTSVSGITATTGLYSTVDRWKIIIIGSGTYTQTQETDVPTGQGFTSSYKTLCTTANPSHLSTDLVNIRHLIEAQNLKHLKFGTSNAESITLSFWVKSNKTGTGTVNLRQPDAGNRQVSPTYTIDTADTWEKKTITIAGDTSGGFSNNNGEGLTVEWFLNSGTNYSTGTNQTSWTSYNATDRNASNLDIGASVSDYLQITGVQLEVGENATPFEYRPYDMELARCKRYYQLHGRGPVGIWNGATNIESHFIFSPEMRATPTFTVSGGTVNISNKTNGNTANCTPSVVNFGGSNKGASYAQVTNANITSPSIGHLAQFRTDDWMRFDAEL